MMSTGGYEEAIVLLEKAVRAAPFNPRARCLLGESQIKSGNFNAAILNLEKAVQAVPNSAGYHSSLAHALMPERPDDAIPHFRAAIRLGSTSPEVFCNLASILLHRQRPEEALQVCDLGLQAWPEHFAMSSNRAMALQILFRYDEALASRRRQLELQPDSPKVWCNMANLLGDLRRLPEAEEALRHACRLAPENGDAHFYLANLLLLLGQYREGFREYEWRWKSKHTKDTKPPNMPPLWDGSFLAGKRILLHAEQGFGDSIQFARYLPLVAKLGGHVVLAVSNPLCRLMRFLPGGHQVVPALTPSGFATHCPLLSLPLMFGTDLESIPPPAPFVVPPSLRETWEQRIASGKPKVALIWAGRPTHPNNRNRSLSLRLLLPLITAADAIAPNVDFFSLQLGSPAEELKSEGLSNRVRDLSPFLTDFAETAAALSSVDLVISADTAVAHLAASLGKPVWMFVPFSPDWRWLLDRNDSPWYPSMRLFRQKTLGDWETVVQEMLAELQDWLQKAVPARSPACITAPTDVPHPANATTLQPSSDSRAKLAADFIPAGATVLDLGCGTMALETYLPYGCSYLPCDSVQHDERTIICNFNGESLPAKKEATHVVALGVLENIHDWRGFLRQLCAFRIPVIFSYHPTDYTQQLDRAALGWANHISLDDLCSEVYRAGFLVQTSTRVDNQVLLRIQPGQRRAPGNPRVLVLSGNHYGNLGGRLGFHLINSLLPGFAEVHHANFLPWNLPPGDFDLLIVGVGNSMFEPILTEELLSLVRRTPKSVGIFGTQYREQINSARFAQLLDALTVWFARSEEDLLLYGKGRANAIHLGNWLIDAFPMTCWTRNETLNVGKEIWNDLPLDRTIQQIQQYRNVGSERIHPLLCALTSAERVAYSEQRDRASGQPSGKFRGMLMDIFGRTWPESSMFEFRRECVADYRTRVQRIMAGMPQLFEQLLSLH